MAGPWEHVDLANPNPTRVAEAAELCRGTGSVYSDVDSAKMQRWVDGGVQLHVFNRPNWLACGYKLYGHRNWAHPFTITDGVVSVENPDLFFRIAAAGESGSDLLDTISVTDNGNPVLLDGMQISLIADDPNRTITLTESGNIELPDLVVTQELWNDVPILLTYNASENKWFPTAYRQGYPWRVQAKMALICLGSFNDPDYNTVAKAKDIIMSMRDFMDVNHIDTIALKCLAGMGVIYPKAEETFLMLPELAHEFNGDFREARWAGTSGEKEWWTLTRLPENRQLDGLYTGRGKAFVDAMRADMVVRNDDRENRPPITVDSVR